MNGMTTWASPNGQRFQVSPDAIPGLEPFFQRLNELHPGYQSLGGYANRPMRTLDGRDLGGVSTHATGSTLDIKAPDHILRQMAQEFPGVKWGGNFKGHYDPVHFEFGGAPKPAQTAAQPQQQPQPQPQAAQPMNEPQQREPTFLENLQGRMSSPMFQQGLGMFLAASQGGDLNQGMNAGQSRATSMREAMLKDMEIGQQRQQQQQVAQMLQNPQQFGNIPPALIEIAKATKNMGPIQDYIIKAQSAGQTDDIKEFTYAKQQGFGGSFQEWMNTKRANAGSYAKEFTTLKGPGGEDILIQPSSQGGYKNVDLPKGATLASGIKTIDTGTEIITLNAKSGDVIARQPKQLAEAERQKVAGEAQGKAQVDLPVVESNAKNIHTYIDGVLNDKYLDNMVGWNAYTPNVTPQARTLQAKINQLGGQGFLIAFQNLKGAGAITEQEGAKATASLSRLQEMIQSGKDYREALRDFKSEVTRMLDVARMKANPRAGSPAPTSTPDQSPAGGGWSIQKVQ